MNRRPAPPAPELCRLEDVKRAAREHRLFPALVSADLLCGYMGFQVWCVWDFMLLTKSIQRDLQGHERYWLPSPNPVALRAIDELLLEEETDAAGRPAVSHFELFLAAMRQAAVDTRAAADFTAALRAGAAPVAAMRLAGAPPAAINFVAATVRTTGMGLAERAAVLHHSREDLVPWMLQRIAVQILQQDARLDGFAAYVARHIELDTGTHSALSATLVHLLCTPEETQSATHAAIAAVEARIDYLDAIAEELGV